MTSPPSLAALPFLQAKRVSSVSQGLVSRIVVPFSRTGSCTSSRKGDLRFTGLANQRRSRLEKKIDAFLKLLIDVKSEVL